MPYLGPSLHQIREKVVTVSCCSVSPCAPPGDLQPRVPGGRGGRGAAPGVRGGEERDGVVRGEGRPPPALPHLVEGLHSH